jgi:hypothetical protein
MEMWIFDTLGNHFGVVVVLVMVTWHEGALGPDIRASNLKKAITGSRIGTSKSKVSKAGLL